MDLKVTGEDVAMAFQEFVRLHGLYKKDHGIKNAVANVHEVCNSMTDKHGRICRQVKHVERKDPKPGFPGEMAEDFVGYLNYGLMLMQHYGTDISDGMRKELGKAAEQHKEKS